MVLYHKKFMVILCFCVILYCICDGMSTMSMFVLINWFYRLLAVLKMLIHVTKTLKKPQDFVTCYVCHIFVEQISTSKKKKKQHQNLNRKKKKVIKTPNTSKFVSRVRILYKNHVACYGNFIRFLTLFFNFLHSLASSPFGLSANFCTVLNRLEVSWSIVTANRNIQQPNTYTFSMNLKGGSNTDSARIIHGYFKHL